MQPASARQHSPRWPRRWRGSAARGGWPLTGVTFPPAVVGGDVRVPQIAAASILAKVTRDRLMACLARRHPAYMWERNVGYGTAGHRAALAAIGATAHHRRSFAPVAAIVSG